VLAKLDEVDGDPQTADEHLSEAAQRGDVNTVPEAWLAVARHQEGWLNLMQRLVRRAPGLAGRPPNCYATPTGILPTALLVSANRVT
jgi:hypothetical protein